MNHEKLENNFFFRFVHKVFKFENLSHSSLPEKSDRMAFAPRELGTRPPMAVTLPIDSPILY